jgi:Cof subfamily protein (haloacid dehalogenase superfamily)
VRPRYCAALFDEIFAAAGVDETTRALEMGPGTGQATEAFLRRGCHVTAVELGENLADFLDFAPVKILMSVLPEQLKAVQQRIAAFLPEELTVVQTAPFYLEVIPKRINKGQGIRDICRTLDMGPEAVIAFGDAENDIPMLLAAGLGVAMGNATAAVKAAADYVTRSNNEDGIAAALCQLMPDLEGDGNYV